MKSVLRISARKLSLQYSKTKKELSFEERATAIIGSNILGQLSSLSPDHLKRQNQLDNNAFSSNVPYICFDKQVATLYDIPITKLFKDFELFVCTKKTSEHVKNLEEREFLPNLISLTLGSNEYMTKFFESAGRYPPRAVISGYLDLVDPDSALFSSMWKQGFSEHTHVSSTLKSSDICLYRLRKITSAFYLGFGGEMEGLSMSKLSQVAMDPLSRSMLTTIRKLNSKQEELNDLLKKGFGVEKGEKFIYHFDRFGIRFLGRPHGSTKNEDWVEYACEFGEEIKSTSQLQDYLLKFHLGIE
jgi:hypothetical protein